jgi:NAD(P)H-nitrite reductase large subunit
MKLVIIGNGITGLSAAREVRKRLPGAKIQVISSEYAYPFSRTALMYVYMGHVSLEATECYARDFYAKNRIELLHAQAERADTNAKCVFLADGTLLPYDALLIAAGSAPARYGWPGQDLRGVQGLYSLQDLTSIQDATGRGIERAVVVGGGLIGIELAEMLHSKKIPVSLIVREASYASHILPAEESAMVNQEILRHGVDLRLSSNLKEIRGKDGAVVSIVTDDGVETPCNFVGLTAGVAPRIEFATASNVSCARGVLVNDGFETSAKGIFAAGDCAQFQKEDGTPGRIEQLWYTGRIQGTAAGAAISDFLQGKKSAAKYVPDVFFNSAKFFTLEYQTYGAVPPQSQSIFFSDPARNRSIRVAYADDSDKHVLGFVLMGVRYRQEVCQKWIREQKSISYVLDHLHEANFDPEFSKKYESAVRAVFGRSP